MNQATPQDKKVINFEQMSKGALLRYQVPGFEQAYHKVECSTEDAELRAHVIEHFWNVLAVDAPGLIADILNMGRDNNVEELNKR